MRGKARAAVVGLLALGIVGVGGVGLIRRPGPAPARPAAPALESAPVIGSGSLATLIAGLQERLRAVPGDWEAYAELGLAYVQQARLTADPSYYPRAEGTLTRSLDLHPGGNFQALTGMAALAAARHDFAAALEWGQRAVGVDPASAHARAVVGDALVELGRYREAFEEYGRMIELRPDLSTYARVSYAWELQGRPDNAARAMRLALEAAGTPADAAWAMNQLGDLAFNTGHPEEAARWYGRAEQVDPSFVPALAGLARVAWARGRPGEAAPLLRRVVERFPLPEYVIALADLYRTTGRPALAARQDALVRVEERLFRAGGVNVDLEVALFEADRGHPAEALRAAREEWRRRRSIQVADALAWALHVGGRDREALRYARLALRLGTRNALFFFHRGMIELALGQRSAARSDLRAALRINPHFSILWSARAARTLASLEGGP